MVHSATSNGQQFRSYDFWKMAGLLNCSSGQTGHPETNWLFDQNLPWQPRKVWIPKSSLTYSDFCWLLIRLHLIHGLTTMSFQSGLWCWTVLDRSATEVKPQVWGIRCLNISEVWVRILQLTYSAFHCLLIHTNPITTTMVTAIWRQQSHNISAELSEINFVWAE
jgi:hypothetical protein